MWKRFLTVAGVLCAAPSCTLAGAGIGSTIPDYSSTSVGEARDGVVNVGDRVAVVRASDGAEIVGKFRGLDVKGLEVDTGYALVAVETSDVRSFSVAHGNYWLEGAALGLATDIAVALLVGTSLSRAYPDTSAFGNIHIGSDGVTVGAH